TDEDRRAIETLDRSRLMAVQTPQTFDCRDILRAHEQAFKDGFVATDDAALYEKYIAPSRLVAVEGGGKNRKITTMEDLRMARENTPPQTRVGFGYDAHRLVPGRKLVLCGVEIPHETGLLGHSDADCATHALMDALLSAACLGDIGRMFPDTDYAYKDVYSIELLKKVMGRLSQSGISLVNADITIIAQRPKLAGFMDDMRQCLAKAMNMEASRVNVKATTTERMGFEGREEGISACAVALVRHG
ncbi:MAG: 2-C-methyl-D-erythritol 2,4-cyclodiphosphate synthase, partial [Clostridia bacterium]|nr:2-C-methyl-D-erythritol 2,4-cyclodiphosphate synthase [Clostridia bacterium]